jgi:hypothetical protein
MLRWESQLTADCRSGLGGSQLDTSPRRLLSPTTRSPCAAPALIVPTFNFTHNSVEMTAPTILLLNRPATYRAQQSRPHSGMSILNRSLYQNVPATERPGLRSILLHLPPCWGEGSDDFFELEPTHDRPRPTVSTSSGSALPDPSPASACVRNVARPALLSIPLSLPPYWDDGSDDSFESKPTRD